MDRFFATEYRGEYYTHRKVWDSARRIYAQALANEADRAAFHMAAMLLARLTVEAYCNFLIDVLDHEISKNEKKYFGSNTAAKVRWIAKRVGFKLGGVRAYQTFRGLDKFRDRLVHAKPDTYGGVIFHLEPGSERPEMEQRGFERSVSPKIAARVMEDTAQLCELLHQQVLSKTDKEHASRLDAFALVGAIHRQHVASAREFLVFNPGEPIKFPAG